VPQTLSYPGVYVEEIPSGIHPITGVATSNTAFIDYFRSGPVDEPVQVTSFGDFERQFGGLDRLSEASYAIQQYYLNGGSIAWVVRVLASNAQTATAILYGDAVPGSGPGSGSGPPGSGPPGSGPPGSGPPGSGPPGSGPGPSIPAQATKVFTVLAASKGAWGNLVEVAVDRNVPGTIDPVTQQRLADFNLVAREIAFVGGRSVVRRLETFRNLSMDKQSPRYAVAVVEQGSRLIRLQEEGSGAIPAKTGDDVIGDPRDGDFIRLGLEDKGGLAGSDGALPGSGEWRDQFGPAALKGDEATKTGLHALDKIAPEIFNILCLPATATLSDAGAKVVLPAAQAYCEDKRAFLIVDIPAAIGQEADAAARQTAMRTWLRDFVEANGLRNRNAAVYFPQLHIPDPLNENRDRLVGASGTLAGIYARTDANRGVWKAPAGTDANLVGATLDVKLTDLENGRFNPLGVNVLRVFPVFGGVSWGARTLDGADQQASEWKYIPVRRTALYIEESLYQGLKWVVFEPNDEPLWAQIRLNVGAFMHNLFRQGAFQGTSPREAYLVKCDSETTTQNDIDLGIVNILVGFAPLKPAEFVVIRIQQITRPPET
jgi:phage tail sheath protein FI